MKFLLISDIHHFSTKDIYDGYAEAFQKLGVDYDVAAVHSLTQMSTVVNLTPDGAFGMVLAKLLNKENEFTHVFFVSGLCVPPWVWKSCYDKNVGVIASDDPHASKVLESYKDYISYWFTNEKKLENKEENIYYIPTATSSNLPTIEKSEIPTNMQFDIVFIGTVYDDRISPLEQACKYCEENGLTIKIIGPLLNTPKDSIIRKYAEDGIIANNQTKLFYRGSRVVINIDRRVDWNPNEKEGNTLLIDVGEPYSMNPRAYEIAGCRTAQLFVNPRQEVKDVFGDNVFCCGYEDVKEGLDKIFKSDTYEVLAKVNSCFNIVKKEHMYIHRANRLLSYVKEIDLKGEKNEI